MVHVEKSQQQQTTLSSSNGGDFKKKFLSSVVGGFWPESLLMGTNGWIPDPGLTIQTTLSENEGMKQLKFSHRCPDTQYTECAVNSQQLDTPKVTLSH